jgi:cell division protein ZapA
MSELSIVVKIAEREYPMKVTTEEKEKIKRAEHLIAGKIKFFRESYKIKDVQDLFAMVAFDAIVDMLNGEKKLVQNNDTTKDQYTTLLNIVKSI